MPMLRKLIALAVTTGLAKKAWDSYHAKPAASGTRKGWRDDAARRPNASTESRESGPARKTWESS